MTDARSAWNDTGEQLTALGSKLGAHFEQQRGPERDSAREQTQEAFRLLGDAIKDAFDALGAAARDDAVRQDAKQVGRSLIGALDVTLREVSDEVRKVFDRSSADSPAEGGTAEGGTAEGGTAEGGATEGGKEPGAPREPGAPTEP